MKEGERESTKRIEGEKAQEGLKEREHEKDLRRERGNTEIIEGERARKGLKERESTKRIVGEREHEKD